MAILVASWDSSDAARLSARGPVIHVINRLLRLPVANLLPPACSSTGPPANAMTLTTNLIANYARQLCEKGLFCPKNPENSIENATSGPVISAEGATNALGLSFFEVRAIGISTNRQCLLRKMVLLPLNSGQ